MHKDLKLTIYILLSILFGVFICIVIKKFTLLSLNPNVAFEINPFEIISLIINGLLAIYITRKLAKQNDLEKTEKDLLIKYLEDFKSVFSSKIETLLLLPEFSSNLTNSNFKVIRKKIDTLINLSVEYKFTTENDEIAQNLKSKVTDIWELFTDTPQKANGKSDISIQNDIDRLRLEKVNKIETTVIEIEKLIFQFAMKINKK